MLKVICRTTFAGIKTHSTLFHDYPNKNGCHPYSFVPFGSWIDISFRRNTKVCNTRDYRHRPFFKNRFHPPGFLGLFYRHLWNRLRHPGIDWIAHTRCCHSTSYHNDRFIHYHQISRINRERFLVHGPWLPHRFCHDAALNFFIYLWRWQLFNRQKYYPF